MSSMKKKIISVAVRNLTINSSLMRPAICVSQYKLLEFSLFCFQLLYRGSHSSNLLLVAERS